MSDDILNSGLPAEDAEKIADAAAKPVDLANDVDWRLRVASLEDEVRELKAALFEHKDVLENHAISLENHDLALETQAKAVGDILSPPDVEPSDDENQGNDIHSRLTRMEDGLRTLMHPSKWADVGLL